MLSPSVCPPPPVIRVDKIGDKVLSLRCCCFYVEKGVDFYAGCFVWQAPQLQQHSMMVLLPPDPRVLTGLVDVRPPPPPI
jgi:hypothetical protein